MFFYLTLQLYAAIEDVIQYPTEFQKSYKFLAATALKGKIATEVTVSKIYTTTQTGDQYAYVTSIMGFNRSGKYVTFAHAPRISHAYLLIITTPHSGLLQKLFCLSIRMKPSHSLGPKRL